MKRATLALVAVVVLLAAAALVVVVGTEDRAASDPGTLETEWVADTGTEVHGNHHRAAVFETAEGPAVAVPLNGDGEDCRVSLLDAGGAAQWEYQISPAQCHAHAVGDVAVGPFPTDEPSVLVSTGEQQVLAIDAQTGERRFEAPLGEFGYSPPVVLQAPDRTLVVTDFYGNLSGLAPDGEERWSVDLGARVWSSPLVVGADDGDGTAANASQRRVVVAGGTTGESGFVRAFGSEGSEAWTTETDRPVLSFDRLGASNRLVAATRAGSVLALDATNGTELWRHSFVGETRVATADDAAYVVDDRGTVRKLDAADGSLVWERQLGESTQVPMRVSLVDVSDGGADGTQTAPVVLRPGGRIAVLDPRNGTLLADRDVDSELYASPTAVDLTGDGAEEVVVVYADGRTAAFGYEPRE